MQWALTAAVVCMAVVIGGPTSGGTSWATAVVGAAPLPTCDTAYLQDNKCFDDQGAPCGQTYKVCYRDDVVPNNNSSLCKPHSSKNAVCTNPACNGLFNPQNEDQIVNGCTPPPP